VRTVAILPGDGIGPEVIAQSRRVLDALTERGLPARAEEAPIGATAYHLTGHPYPEATRELVGRADAVLFGAVGDARLDHLGALRPDMAIGAIRQDLGLSVSLREVSIPDEMAELSPLRPELARGVQLLIVREMGGDVYFGTPRGQRTAPDGPFAGEAEGFDTMRYAETEVRRVAQLAFEIARERRRRVVSADKANVLETSRLWRRVVTDVAAGFPGVECTHLYADNVAMALVTRPRDFDVILTPNLFGDLLTDIASVLAGSIGMPGSALLSPTGRALYEPGHGSAFDIAGQDRANPIAAIRCVALLMVHTFKRPELAAAVERAVTEALGEGLRTADIDDGTGTLVGTTGMGDAVLAALTDILRKEAT